ncbi:hypothetical protein [Elizabethkingia meningoseptica]|uniref:hypothetical protein n=1 Tax=Elizabethkingia meningoseptica TaxID=238 RepID=UPI00201115C1|nr:hypothetical protein [Elizabethkingia meningoseptica]MCL1675155.1 hypothetical protein [Elizabethkingia meningoseptica]MCL1685477.1 hypothetical protein [Elizabethkingia meningoseptica]
MIKKKRNTGKVVLWMLGATVLLWLIFLVFYFISFPNKMIILSIVAVISKILLLIAFFILAQGYWRKLKMQSFTSLV